VTSTPRRTTSALAAGLAGSLLVGLLGGSSVAAPRETLFPGQGNAGYQVRAYDVSIDYQPTTNRAIATVRIRAVARTAMRSFQLDFDGPRVTSVVVDGQPARSTREGTELVVTPSAVVDAGRFTVTVSYDGRPPEVVDADGSTEGWVRTSDGAIAINEPVGAMTPLSSSTVPRARNGTLASLRIRIERT